MKELMIVERKKHVVPIMKLGVVILILVFCASAAAQEVAYLDLRGAKPRTSLRFPEIKWKCAGNTCSSEGHNTTSIGCGSGSPNDPRALKVTVVSLDKNVYRQGERVEIEIEIQNEGSVPIKLPWTPHRADLQSPNETMPLRYSHLRVDLELRQPDNQDSELVKIVDLYGNDDVPVSVLTLRPGELARVRVFSRMEISKRRLGEPRWTANAMFLLQTEDFIPNADTGGFSFRINNDYPRQIRGQPVEVEILKRGQISAPQRNQR